jgi:hypothetical protein
VSQKRQSSLVTRSTARRTQGQYFGRLPMLTGRMVPSWDRREKSFYDTVRLGAAANNKKRGILEEFVAADGYHEKSASRVLNPLRSRGAGKPLDAQPRTTQLATTSHVKEASKGGAPTSLAAADWRGQRLPALRRFASLASRCRQHS